MNRLGHSLLLVPMLLLSGCPLEEWFGEDGSVTLMITDAPVDEVTSVRLTIVAVELVPASGSTERFEFEEPIIINNLLDLSRGATRTLLSAEEVSSGDYVALRLFLSTALEDAVVVEQTGGEFPLAFAAQQPTGSAAAAVVEVEAPFEIDGDEQTNLVLDLDLRRSLTKPEPGTFYQLWPAFRIIDRDEAGSVSGTVTASLLQAANCDNDLALDQGNAVYLHDANVPTRGDVFIDTSGQPLDQINPRIVVPVTLNADGEYVFSASFVPEGRYSVALSCQALRDNPQSDDVVEFTRQAEILVSAGDNREVNFAP